MSDEQPKKKGGLKLGSKVWVRDVDVQNPDVFVLATLKGIAGKFAQIETEAGDKFETDLFFPANPPGQNQNDHTALMHLSDATLLANSKDRYAIDEIYTFVGPILVAINPFKYIERLYTPELMAQCRKFPTGHPERPAHTFSMAEAAYMQLIKQKKPQVRNEHFTSRRCDMSTCSHPFRAALRRLAQTWRPAMRATRMRTPALSPAARTERPSIACVSRSWCRASRARARRR